MANDKKKEKPVVVAKDELVETYPQEMLDELSNNKGDDEDE